MANWKLYKIINRNTHYSYITFDLDDYVSYNDGNKRSIDCVNRSPFSDWHPGTYLEVNTDVIHSYRVMNHNLDSDTEVKVAGSISMSLVRVQEQTSSLQTQNYYLQSKTSDLQQEKSNLQSLIEAGQRELNNRRNEVANYSNQLNVAQNQLATTQNQLTTVQNQLTARNNAFDTLTQQFNALQIESNNKDNELERRANKIKEVKELLGRSQEEVLDHKLGIKEGVLESLIQQLGINRARIRALRNAYQELIRARENYNQEGINNADNNIEQVKDELLDGGVNVANMQKVCRKAEKLAKLRIAQEKLYQEQFEARQQQAPPRNNI